MTTQAKTAIAVLAAAVVVLAVLFSIAAVDAWGGSMHDDDSDPYMGMMGAMDDMDSGDMTRHMQRMMDEETFALMQEHMADHESMPMSGDWDVDAMMHQMIDHMMQERDGDHHSGMPGMR
ncbi:MAG TPA: hypothetical protein VMR52_03175 [Dehalococcoidia bacterium]|nr:hypothetical protein [Dehalococcoidia bacterium]